MKLDRDEYVEQSYLFHAMADRLQQAVAAQDLLQQLKEELLCTTKLPMAVDFMSDELRHTGGFSTAMAKLPHYFAPFQTFVVEEAERERGKFDLRIALVILDREAKYRGEDCSAQGLFFYQFEALCKNRLGYDRGLAAMAKDPFYDENWREWILIVRRQVGLVDFADLICARSQHYLNLRKTQGVDSSEEQKPILFGEKEGKIAWAHRRRDPLILFSALQRHLGYPEVPRPTPVDESRQVIPLMQRRLERLEARVKLLEEEGKGGIDLRKLMEQQQHLPPEAP